MFDSIKIYLYLALVLIVVILVAGCIYYQSKCDNLSTELKSANIEITTLKSQVADCKKGMENIEKDSERKNEIVKQTQNIKQDIQKLKTGSGSVKKENTGKPLNEGIETNQGLNTGVTDTNSMINVEGKFYEEAVGIANRIFDMFNAGLHK